MAGADKEKGDLEASFLPKLERGPRIVGFVGDGLNDCPALAAAHVGVVLQEVGSQVTIDAAAAMLQNDLGELPAAIVIARRAIDHARHLRQPLPGSRHESGGDCSRGHRRAASVGLGGSGQRRPPRRPGELALASQVASAAGYCMT